MTKVLDLATLAAKVYDGAFADGWKAAGFRPSWRGLLTDGLQAAHYTRGVSGAESVVAFRGTNLTWRIVGAMQDLLADLTLGLGANSAYFTAAEKFVRSVQGASESFVLTGHSLGGAVAQVVGNRMNLPFATFNAPGVAVFASRNESSANPIASMVRAGGLLVSAVVHPVQAYEDVRAAFRYVRGLNVCLDLDQVNKIGIHYGEKVTIPSKIRHGSLLDFHSIDNVIASLEDDVGKNCAMRESRNFS